MRISINVPEGHQSTMDTLRRLREAVNDGRTLYVVTHDECQDGSEAIVVGVSSEQSEEKRG